MGSFDASNTRCDGEDCAAAISSGSSDEIAGEGFWNAAGQGFKDDIEDDDDDDDDDVRRARRVFTVRPIDRSKGRTAERLSRRERASEGSARGWTDKET